MQVDKWNDKVQLLNVTVIRKVTDEVLFYGTVSELMKTRGVCGHVVVSAQNMLFTAIKLT